MAKLETLFNIGDPVYVEIDDFKLKGNIRVVLFANAKVRYSVSIKLKDGSRTTLHNIDSIHVIERKDGLYIDFGEDNYS